MRKSELVAPGMTFGAFLKHHASALRRVRALEQQDQKMAEKSEMIGNALRPGEMYFANDAVFTQQYFDEPLTTYAVGWKDPNKIEDTLEFFAPSAVTPRRFTYKSWTNVDEFLSEDAWGDLRAIGQEFASVTYTGSEVHARTDNRGLRIRVDLDEVADPSSPLAGGFPAYQARVVEKLKRRILRNSLRRTITLLAAASINNAKTWSTGASDADNDIVQQLVTATSQGGIRPNRVGYGDTAWARRFQGYRAQNVAGAYASAGLNPETVASLLAIDKAYISKERYSAAGAGLSEVVGNMVFMFYAQDGVDIEDPTNIKRFYSNTDSGGPWRVYVQQVTSKLMDITVEHYEKVVITSLLGLNTFAVS